jgi:hypothetical protein
MPYIYRVSRRTNTERQPTKAAVTVSTVSAEPEVTEEPSYRDLQAEAKDLGISAKQSKEDLKKAIAEAGE